MTRYFVSGHLHITEQEFDEHYIPRLTVAMSDDSSFVVGDARGVDAMAQRFLHDRGAKVTVFHMHSKPRNNIGFKTMGGFESDESRDSMMTTLSDADIAWVRPGREKSGTARNLERRGNT